MLHPSKCTNHTLFIRTSTLWTQCAGQQSCLQGIPWSFKSRQRQPVRVSLRSYRCLMRLLDTKSMAHASTILTRQLHLMFCERCGSCVVLRRWQSALAVVAIDHGCWQKLARGRQLGQQAAETKEASWYATNRSLLFSCNMDFFLGCTVCICKFVNIQRIFAVDSH